MGGARSRKRRARNRKKGEKNKWLEWSLYLLISKFSVCPRGKDSLRAEQQVAAASPDSEEGLQAAPHTSQTSGMYPIHQNRANKSLFLSFHPSLSARYVCNLDRDRRAILLLRILDRGGPRNGLARAERWPLHFSVVTAGRILSCCFPTFCPSFSVLVVSLLHILYVHVWPAPHKVNV